MRDPELVARAGYAAARLEQAWERWRALHGLGGSADPLASYVGYSHKEPMGQPRVVIGVDAAEAEMFADFLEGHECAAQATDFASAAGASPASATPASPAPASAAGLSPAASLPPAEQRPLTDPGRPPVNGGVAHPSDSGALYPPISGPQRVVANGSLRPAETGAEPGSRPALAGADRPGTGPQAPPDPATRVFPAPVPTFTPIEEIESPAPPGQLSPPGQPSQPGHARRRVAMDPQVASPEPPDAIAAELAGWASGELPGQASEQLASWGAAETAGARALDRSRSAR